MSGLDRPNPAPRGGVVGQVLHRLDRAGAEVLAAAIGRGVRGEGIETVYFCLDGVGAIGEELQKDGFEVVHLRRRPGVDRRVIGRLRAACAERGVTVLHAHQYTPFFYAAMARKRLRGVRVIFTEHGRHVPDVVGWKRRLVNKTLLRRGDSVTAVSAYVKRAVEQKEGLRLGLVGGIDVVPNGITPEPMPAAYTRTEARVRLGLPMDARVIFHTARFHPVKDHGLSLRAFAQVLKQLPGAGAWLVLIGDGPERGFIEQQVRVLALKERAVLTGVRDDARQLLPGADVAVLSSKSEGMSVTILEAMAAGVPVVATDVGGNGELIDHGKTGLLTPVGGAGGGAGEAEALGAELAGLLKDEGMAGAYAAAAKARFLANFTESRMIQAYKSLYAG
ncbi:MAG: glycosyltransferase [Planctomycetota bacterium]